MDGSGNKNIDSTDNPVTWNWLSVKLLQEKQVLVQVLWRLIV